MQIWFLMYLAGNHLYRINAIARESLSEEARHIITNSWIYINSNKITDNAYYDVFPPDLRTFHLFFLSFLLAVTSLSISRDSDQENLLIHSSPGLTDQYNKGIIPTMVNEVNSHQPVRFMSWRRRTETDMDGTNVKR